MKVLLRALLLLVLLPGCSPGPQVTWPGPKPDGTTLLPNGWSLQPFGHQIPLAQDLPVRMAWHPAGRFLAIQHAGYGKHVVAILDGAREAIRATVDLGKTWSGMVFSPDGTRLYASGGVDDVIKVLAFDGKKGAARLFETWQVGDPERLDLPAGMCTAADGSLFVVLQRSDALVRLDPDGKRQASFPLPQASFPFECVLAPDERTIWVSLWGAQEVLALDTVSGVIRHRVPTGQHPSEMLVDGGRGRLMVSNGNENTVTVVDMAQGKVQETLTSSLFPHALPGSTPNSLALSANGQILLIANADNNNCAVVDVSRPGHSRSLGFIPLGAYPTSIRFSKAGARVYVANGKGSGGSRPNPGGPDPSSSNPRNLAEYTGAMFRGSLSIFDFPGPALLKILSKRAYACSPLHAGGSRMGERPKDSPIPAHPGQPSPIKHCIYIIKENRTYDQVLGDDPRGNGDPTLCLFPQKVSPNHHALARDFVLLDNFYVDAEVSADGHEWSMGAYASDFVERSWPVSYGGKARTKTPGGRRLRLGYSAEGMLPVAFPKMRYLWNLARAAGISYRNYGEFVGNGATRQDPTRPRLPVLAGHTDTRYRGFDLGYTDVDRAREFLRELKIFSKQGHLPRLMVLRLPSDHTSGTRPGSRTPRSCVADNDLALGMIVEGLSRSPFWRSLCVFVLEDDAQNGPDHVDAHRSVAFLAGPHVKRGKVVSSMYSTSSFLRTMELILGLGPMSQFDASARPLDDCFTSQPDFSPWHHRPASWPLDEKNAKNAVGADLSKAMDLATEDSADDIELNRVIWQSIKGPQVPMPSPRRAAFVMPQR